MKAPLFLVLLAAPASAAPAAVRVMPPAAVRVMPPAAALSALAAAPSVLSAPPLAAGPATAPALPRAAVISGFEKSDVPVAMALRADRAAALAARHAEGDPRVAEVVES